MASGRAFYDACCAFEGEPYSTNDGRTDPNSGYKDCSGLVAAGFEVVQGYELGAYVSTTIFEQSVNAGLEIPLMAAENIVGALIFKPENPYEGWGANGHIAVSDGYGGTIEATPPRVQRLPLGYNAPWSSRAAYAIDLDYSNYGEGSPGEDADDVKALIIQKAGEPFLYVWVNGYKYATKNRTHAELMHAFGQSANGPDDPAVLDAGAFDSIPDLDSLVS